MDRLRIDIIRYNLGILAEKVKYRISSRIPRNLMSGITATGKYIGHFDDCPVLAFSEFTEILEGNRVLCIVNCSLADPRGELSSETRKRWRRKIGITKRSRIRKSRDHVTDELSTDNAGTSSQSIDTASYTFSAESTSESDNVWGVRMIARFDCESGFLITSKTFLFICLSVIFLPQGV